MSKVVDTSQANGSAYAILFAVIIVVGIFLRFYNIDKREYWGDEAITNLTVSGHTRPELENFYDGHAMQARDWDKFQTPDGPVSGCVAELIQKGGQHPPFFYMMCRFMASMFGTSVFVMRFLPALFGVLFLPAAYWLAMELYQSRLIAMTLMAIIAVSPCQVLYAQDAREYSLLCFLIALSSAMMLSAARSGSTKLWNAYAVLTALSFYTQPLAVLVAGAQTLSLLVSERFRLNQSTLNQLKSILYALLAFLPWGLCMWSTHDKMERTTNWLKMPIPFNDLTFEWMRNVVSIFFDLSTDQAIIRATFICIMGFAWLFFSRAAGRGRIFIALLMICSVLPFVFYDVAFGGIRSTIVRYCMPFVLCVQVATAFVIAQYLASRSAVIRKIATAVFALFLVAEFAFCIFDSTLISRRQFLTGYNLQAIAKTVNNSSTPLIICSANANKGPVLALSHLLRRDAWVAVSSSNSVPEIPNGSSQAFLYDVSPGSTRRALSRYSVERLDNSPEFADPAMGLTDAYFFKITKLQ